ncbi:PD-(D/E)XK nuclease-like domain-containing protein [Sphaerisporangium sp. NPDC051011]|uniref:PD-(D/E)XK nuclease-like domain-containing protein n=1 Tax=Sphaerisporangium sp. NPDC051011 TaxID=3155792 RepID=UPI0033C5C69E
MTAVAEAAPAVIQPGVYDIPAEVYHADPVPGRSLSSSGARKLLAPSCPALFRYEQLNPPPAKKVFEVGTAAHKLVLGVGPDLVRIDAEEWRSNAVKAEVAAVRAAGKVPLKPSEYEQVHGMAAAIRRHPWAGPLLSPERGAAEQTLLWQDAASGVWRRALVDHLPYPVPWRRMVVADYKTTTSAATEAVRKAVFNYGYHCQAAWYLDGVEEVGLAESPVMVFVFQEKTAPYLINVVQLDADAIRIGRERNRRAINLYRECVEADSWPDYGHQISQISTPRWAAGDSEVGI